MEPSVTSGNDDPLDLRSEPIGFNGWFENLEHGQEHGTIRWKELPDGTPIRFVLRSLPAGEAVVPDPLYVEINDETKNRHVRLQGWIRDDGEPHFYDIRAVAIDQRQHEDPAEPDLVSPEDLQRWKVKVVQGAIKYATDGDATVPKAWPSKEQHELDRRIARETVRELRRKRGRPGRPGQPWEKKKQAHKLNRVDGVALKDLADQYGVSTSTVGRWVKEVDVAMESQEEGNQ